MIRSAGILSFADFETETSNNYERTLVIYCFLCIFNQICKFSTNIFPSGACAYKTKVSRQQKRLLSFREIFPTFHKNITYFARNIPYFYSFLPNEILLFFLRSNTSGFFINSYAFFAVFVYWQVWAGNPAASLTQQWYFICSPPNLMCTLCSHPLRKCTRRTVRKFNLCRHIA